MLLWGHQGYIEATSANQQIIECIALELRATYVNQQLIGIRFSGDSGATFRRPPWGYICQPAGHWNTLLPLCYLGTTTATQKAIGIQRYGAIYGATSGLPLPTRPTFSKNAIGKSDYCRGQIATLLGLGLRRRSIFIYSHNNTLRKRIHYNI